MFDDILKRINTLPVDEATLNKPLTFDKDNNLVTLKILLNHPPKDPEILKSPLELDEKQKKQIALAYIDFIPEDEVFETLQGLTPEKLKTEIEQNSDKGRTFISMAQRNNEFLITAFKEGKIQKAGETQEKNIRIPDFDF